VAAHDRGRVRHTLRLTGTQGWTHQAVRGKLGGPPSLRRQLAALTRRVLLNMKRAAMPAVNASCRPTMPNTYVAGGGRASAAAQEEVRLPPGRSPCERCRGGRRRAGATSQSTHS
jgi:hypothetical protein